VDKGAQVPRDEDIVKHANALFVEGDTVDGIALLPRPVDNDGSSVNRLRMFSNDDDEAMREIRARFRLTCKPSHRFLQLNVGDLAESLEEIAGIGRVIAAPLPPKDPFPEDPSHALVLGLPPKGVLDDLIGDLIRRQIKRVHPAVP
jgi:hypothetical protein